MVFKQSDTMHSQFHLYKASTSSQFIANQAVNSNYTQLYSLNSLNKVNYQIPLPVILLRQLYKHQRLKNINVSNFTGCSIYT